MKKIIFAVMAVAAICFTSCGNKTEQGEAIDSVAIADSIAGEAAQQAIDALTSSIDGKDAGKLQEAIDAVKAKIAELVKQNPEAAKEYVAKVQEFIKENQDKIKEFAGNNAAVQTAVAALTSADATETVSNFVSSIGESAADATEAAKDAAADAADKAVDAAKDAAKAQAEAAKDAAKEKASSAIDNAAANAKKSLGL